MNQILRCDWLPDGAQDGAILPARDFPLYPAKKFPESHILNPLLTKLVRSRWFDIGLVLYFVLSVNGLDFVLVHKHAKKELRQY